MKQDYESEAFAALLEHYFDEFGGTVYEFDFSYPTPRELTAPALESVKAFAVGKGENPYERQTGLEQRRDDKQN